MWLHKICMKFFSLLLIPALLPEMLALFVDYSENTELIQQHVGNDVKLLCNLKDLFSYHQSTDLQIHWFFKQCSTERLVTANYCHDIEEEWTQLPCEQNFCNQELLLRNVTEKYSGLYKCTVYPYNLDADHRLDIQLVRTYQLDVKNSSIMVPEFLDNYPLNKTVVKGTQAVFQCRVHSEIHPTIKWFRRRTPPTTSGDDVHTSANENFNTHIVSYNGRTYELLLTAREKHIGDSIYLSKLILNGVRLQDEGIYACVPISYRGHSIREAYLQVNAHDEHVEYWMDYEDENVMHTDPKEFWMLFLMPLGLALLPVMVWLCYVLYRKHRSVLESQQLVPNYFQKEEVEAKKFMLNI